MTVGVARIAPLFARGFDCLQPLTSMTIRRAAASGFGGFAARYLETLTASERDAIFAAGVPLMLLTEARIGEALSVETGRDAGEVTVDRARALGCPASVHITIDLESPEPGSDVAGHVNAFADELRSAGFGAMLYVGQPQPLTGQELFDLAPTRYWKAAGRIVDARGELAEPTCGWCVLQASPLDQDLFGQPVDVDFVQADSEGRRPILWWPS